MGNKIKGEVLSGDAELYPDDFNYFGSLKQIRSREMEPIMEESSVQVDSRNNSKNSKTVSF